MLGVHEPIYSAVIASAATIAQIKDNHNDNESSSRGAGLLSVLARAAFLLPFAINQCGSLVYYLLLGSCDVATMVPAANGAALLFTAATDIGITRFVVGEGEGTGKGNAAYGNEKAVSVNTTTRSNSKKEKLARSYSCTYPELVRKIVGAVCVVGGLALCLADEQSVDA